MDHQIELVLHPGHAKCGTTSIQSYLYENMRLLEEQQIFLPDSRCQFSFESIDRAIGADLSVVVFRALDSWRNRTFAFRGRMDEILERAVDTRCQKILISSENLTNLHQKHAAGISPCARVRLFHVSRSYTMSGGRMIGFFRHGSSGGTRRVDRLMHGWIIACASLPPFLRNAHHFQDIYGATSVTVVPVHPAAFLNGSLVADFCRRLGFDAPDNDTGGEHKNLSVNPYLCEILADINAAADSIDAESIKGLLDRSWLRRPLYRRHNHYMTKACRDRVLDYYENDNRELHRRFFGSLEYEEIFARVSDVPDADRIHEQLEGLKDVLSIQLGLVWTLLNKEQSSSFGGKSQEILKLLTGATRSLTDARRILANWPDPDAGLNGWNN